LTARKCVFEIARFKQKTMDGILEGGEHLERELTPEPIAAPAMGSFALHSVLIGLVVSWGLLGGLFKHNKWGNQGAGAAMQVNLVSSAIPLPSTQPMNQNVLATEKPSKAPQAPAPKTQTKVDETAIPITGKQVKPQEETTQKTPPVAPPKTDNTARYGEQNGTSIARATQPGVGAIGQAAVGDADFVNMFGWYVRGINSKMSNSWYKQEVDPRTPPGARVYLFFTVHKDGSVSGIRLDRSSGSPTLDQSCMRAAQRVDTFGVLPSAYNKSTLMVSYYCEY
jgi:protein TonB